MTARVAVKRLAAVEVDPLLSNQHEMNAGNLRRQLGFGDDRVFGKVTFVFYTADNKAPIIEEEQFTLYEARTPPRSEWRLYYTSSTVAAHARAGDLMFLFRPTNRSKDLVAIVTRQGTRLASVLATEIARKSPDEISKTIFVDSRNLHRQGLEALLEPLTGSEAERLPTYDLKRHALVRRSIEARRLPGTAEMASAAHDIVRHSFPNGLAPDEFVAESLDAESQLFFTIESVVGDRAIEELRKAGDLDFVRLMKLATSYSQARKSRRGESLQNHFKAILDQRKIRYTAQCPTERGERPDFIFPGHKAYHDPKFPASRLRMVGCKTKLRERYRQLLNEAKRIDVKYGLCVDEGLSDEVVETTYDVLRFFLPKRLLQGTYRGRAVASLLGTVTDLIAELERPA
jgi:hypothetical protein